MIALSLLVGGFFFFVLGAVTLVGLGYVAVRLLWNWVNGRGI